MGILTRFKEIMSSNINALLDKAEDPEKMIDQCLRNVQKDLQNVKSETASVMAEEKRAKRKLDEQQEEMKKLENYAMKALQSGSEDDARKFLAKKSTLANELPSLQQLYDNAALNASNMKKMHDKLVKDVGELESKRSTLKAKFAQAKAQEKINKMVSGSMDANRSVSAFAKYEEAANKALDKASAMSELNSSSDGMDDLMNKYDSDPNAANVDDELERLKQSMNGGSSSSNSSETASSVEVDDELERMKRSLDNA